MSAQLSAPTAMHFGTCVRLVALLWILPGSCEPARFGKIGVLARIHGATGKRLGSSWDRIAGAGLMAAHHVNNRVATLVPEAASLLPEDFQIEIEMADTRSDAREGIEIALEWAKSTIHAIVGPYRSAVSGPVALVADTAHLPVLSWGSTSTALSDTISYRTFGRTIPSDAVTALGVVLMCRDFGWNKIAVIFIDDAYGRGYAQDIATFAGEYGLEIATAQKFFGGNEESVAFAVDNVHSSLARIIVCIAFEVDMDQIVFSAARLNLITEGHVWITTDAIATPADVVSNSNNPPEMARLMSGWFRISVGPFVVDNQGERFQAAWRSEPSEVKMHPLLDEDPAIYEQDCQEFCGFMYDAVWAMAIAISRTEAGPDLSMPGAEILEQLRALTFSGATGTVRFDPETGDRDGSTVPIIIKNFVAVWNEDGSLREMTDPVVWTWDVASGLTQVSDVPPMWPGGNVTWTAPQDGSSCPPGHEFSSTSLSCRPCPVGHELKEQRCQPCQVGTVAPYQGMSQCIPCADGYAAETGMRQCTPCPPNSQRKPNTPGESAVECECSAGYYAKNGLGRGCDVCITGGICEGGDMQPYPMEGFWGDKSCKQFNGTKDCPLWDKFVICNPNWNCLGTQDFLCERGRHGNICQEALDGYYIIGGSFWNPCTSNGSWLTMLYIAVVVVFWFLINHFASQKYHAFNIALLFVQVCAIVGMFNMKWPNNLDYLNIALSVANFDVDVVTPHCIGRWGLGASFYLQLLLPWVFGIARSVFMMLRQYVERRMRRVEGRMIMHSSLKQIMTFVVTMYATLCIKCFQVFRCERYPDGNMYVWFAPEIQCWQPQHIVMVVTASLYIPTVLVGTPIFLFWTVRKHQRDGTLHHAKVVRKWAWLHDAFEAKYKYWEVMLIARRFFIALIAGVVVEPMVQGALSVIVLTGLLAAHVFTKPYIRDDIDVMDFCSIVSTILYVLAGLLIFPNVTEKAQGRVCASDAFLRDEAEYCSGEDALKTVISNLALVLVMVTLGFSFLITGRQIRSSYFSHSASRIVLERCKMVGEEAEDPQEDRMQTLNQVELDEIFQGTWLHAWASRIRDRAARTQSSDLVGTSGLQLRVPDSAASRTLVGSPESFYRINGAIRDLDEDITEFSAKPMAVILRQLCKIPGMIEYLAWKGPEERASLLHFVKEMAEFEVLAEKEEHDPFPLTQLVVDEHRPIIAYFLMTCRPSLIHKFYHLTDAILESNGHQPRTQRHFLRAEERSGSRLDTMRAKSSPAAAGSSPFAFGRSFKTLGHLVKQSVLRKPSSAPDPEQQLGSVFFGRTHSSANNPPAGGDSFRSIRQNRVFSEGGSAGGGDSSNQLMPGVGLGVGLAAQVDLERILAWLPEVDTAVQEKYSPVVTTVKRKIMPKLLKRVEGSEYSTGPGRSQSASDFASSTSHLTSMSRDLTSLRSQQTNASEEMGEDSFTDKWLGVLDSNAAAAHPPASPLFGSCERGSELEDIEEGSEELDSFNRSRRSLLTNSSRNSKRLSAESGTFNSSKRHLSVEDGDLNGYISHPEHSHEDPNVLSGRTRNSLQRRQPPPLDGGSLEIVLEAPTAIMSPTSSEVERTTTPSLADRFLNMPVTAPPAVAREDAAAAFVGEVKLSSELVHEMVGELQEVDEEESYGPITPSPLQVDVGPGPLAWDLQDNLASWTPDLAHGASLV